jgi:hypothetical protein
MMEGFSDNYIKVTSPFKAEWENEIVDWVIWCNNPHISGAMYSALAGHMCLLIRPV